VLPRVAVPSFPPAVSMLSTDFTFTELSGKAREAFKMFIS
jgi:hypothetical protein